jgi:CRISPR-associated protein Csx10
VRGGGKVKTGWITITLLSELCAGTGDGTVGMVDNETAHEHGLPFIPAKRIKGALNEMAKELCDWKATTPSKLKRLFGEPGQGNSGVLQVFDAHLLSTGWPGSPSADNYEQLLRQLKASNLKSQSILELFTSIRTRTAIDEQYAAKKHSLRSVRVIHKGVSLRCAVKLDISEEEEYLAELLGYCVQGLRHLGLGRSRGWGEVRCELHWQDNSDEKTGQAKAPILEHIDHEAEVELTYRVHLEQPVIIAGKDGLYSSTEDWIPGSAMLGSLAAMYIKDYRLGQEAHRDGNFSRLFLRGGVSFGYAFPYVEPWGSFTPCPVSWQQIKNEKKGLDLLNSDANGQEIVRNIGKLVSKSKHNDKTGEEVVYLYAPPKQVRMHHARPLDRGIGHALGHEGGTAQRGNGARGPEGTNGQFFQYVSLEAGQQFQGVWRGKSKDIGTLLECLSKRGNKLRIGRSRTAEYGEVTFIAESIKPLMKRLDDLEKTNRITIKLLSPMLLMDSSGRVDANPIHFVQQLNKEIACEARLTNSYIKYTDLTGYNAKWRMPKQQRQAIAPGSVLQLLFDKAIQPEQLEQRMWGWQTGEGNGQIEIISNPSLDDSVERKNKSGEFLIEEVMAGMSRRSNGERNEMQDDQHEQPARKHSFLVYITGQLEERQQEADNRRQAIECAIEVLMREKEHYGAEKLSSTKLNQLYSLAQTSYSFKDYKSKLQGISNENQREHCLMLIAPLEANWQSRLYLQTYFEILIWEARQRYDSH